MAKLIDLFESRQDELYTKFKQKASGENEPYVVINLTDNASMNPAYEDQSNPISVSAQRDLRRMTNFSKSTKGLVFLAKQQLLQSGNTFAATRIYNPANVLIHSIPFVHAKRHLDLSGGIISTIIGQITQEQHRFTVLQKETVVKYTQTANLNPALIRARSRGGILIPDPKEFKINSSNLIDRLTKLGERTIKNTIDQIISPFIRTVSGFQAQLSGGAGEQRPEITLGAIGKTYYDYMADSYIDIHSTPDNPSPFIDKYKSALRDYKNETKRISIGVGQTEGTTDGKLFRAQNWNSPYYKDLTQLEKFKFIRGEDEFTNDNLDSDSIDVLFKVTNPVSKAVERVRFRAFISGIQESVSPSYNENSYVGRYETFYTYNKLIRDVTFSLTMHSFSSEENKRILQKMTFLTSLAYPLKSGVSDSNAKYLTPLILKFTIGKLYIDQPALIFGIQHNIEDDVSWDIDRQSPMTIQSNISLRILDKQLYTYEGLRSRDIPFGDGYMTPAAVRLGTINTIPSPI